MPSISNLSFSVNYNLVGTPTLVLTDTTSSAPTGMVGYFTVTMPDGYTTNTSEINAGGSASVVLRLDSSGEVQCGNYTIVFEATAAGYFGTEFTRTFNFSYAAPTLVLKNLFNAFIPSLSYRDDTVYTIGSYTYSTVTRAWTVVSTPTGTLTGTSQTMDFVHNGNYYAANYTITLSSTTTYTHTTNAWLTVTQQLSETISSCVSSPKPIFQLVDKISEIQQDETCSINAEFEQVQTLFGHFVDLLKLNLLGNITTEDTYAVYEQLVTILFNESGCNPDNGVLQPYDITTFTNDHMYTLPASYCGLIGDGVAQTFVVTHNLNTDCAMVQVYDVDGSLIECDITILSNNSVEISFDTVPTTDQYKVVVHAGAEVGPQGEPGITIVSDTAPANPYNGLQWFNSDTGATYIYYDNVWVQDANSNVTVQNTANIQWGTIDGTLSLQTDLQNALDAKTPTSRTLTINGTTYDLTANRSWTINSGTWGQINGTLSSQTDLQSALDTKVPTLRTITINGTAYDLSADRSWTITAGVWGQITGTLSSQTDLQSALDAKQNSLSGTGFVKSTGGTISYDTATYTPTSRTITINGTAYDLSADRSWTITAGVWGQITGTLSSQTDLQSALDGKVPITRTLTINGTALDLSADRSYSVGTVTSVDLSVPTGLSISGNPITSSGTLALTFASGYSIPTTTKQSNWDDAYTWVGNFPTQTGNSGKYLTTNGTSLSWASVASGAWGSITGTLSSQTDLQSALDAKVPTTRTLTINGTAFDLSANRSWTITASAAWGGITGTLSSQTDLQSALDAKVPTARTITINGTAFDLSANRSWTIANTQYARRYATSGTYSYCGTAVDGSAEGSAVWRIVRLNVSGAGVVTETLCANNVAWTNYLSATYSTC